MTGDEPGNNRETPQNQLGNQPWDQQNHESSKAFHAFRLYRDLGPNRSTSEVRRLTGKDKRHIERWCRAHEWVRRSQAWDQRLDEVKQNAQTTEIVEMAKRQAQEAKGIQFALGLINREFLKRVQNKPGFLESIPDEELREIMIRVPRSLVSAVDIERTARGVKYDTIPTGVEEEQDHRPVFRVELPEPVAEKEA